MKGWQTRSDIPHWMTILIKKTDQGVANKIRYTSLDDNLSKKKQIKGLQTKSDIPHWMTILLKKQINLTKIKIR